MQKILVVVEACNPLTMKTFSVVLPLFLSQCWSRCRYWWNCCLHIVSHGSLCDPNVQ